MDLSLDDQTHEQDPQAPQNDDRVFDRPLPGPVRAASPANTEERGRLQIDIAPGAEAELGAHRPGAQQTPEQRAAEQDHAGLQEMAENMAQRAREAEERAASHAAELARVQQDAEQKALQQAHQHEIAEEMARRVKEAEDRVAAQAAEVERLRQQRMEQEQGPHGAEKIDNEGRVIQESWKDHEGGITENDLDEFLDEMLQGDAEQRAAGEFDTQDRVRLEAEQREEEERVAREREIALAQLQTVAENVPLPPETEVAELTRPVTQLLFQNLATQLRERGNLVDRDEQISSLDTRKGTARKQRRLRPAGIRKSRMRKVLQTQQATNREGGRVAAIYDKLGWELEDPAAARFPETGEPSTPARQTAGEDPGMAAEEAARAPVQEAAPGRSIAQSVVATQGPGHNDVLAKMDSQTESSGHLLDAERNPDQKRPEAAAATNIVQSSSSEDPGGASGGIDPGSHHAPSAIVREGGRAGKGTFKLIRKTRKNRPTLRDANRAGTRDAAINNALEDESTAPLAIERRVATPLVSSTPATAEGPAEHPGVQFDNSSKDVDSATGIGLQPRPATQYDFRGLARGTPTDPGGNSSNVAAGEPWPPGLSLPSAGTESQQAPNDGTIAITFYIYERDQWQVAHVLAVDPSEPSALQRTVWRYKRQGMFLYNMKMQTVAVSSSFRAATAAGANALLLIPREIKEQMDRKQSIKPPLDRMQSKRTRR